MELDKERIRKRLCRDADPEGPCAEKLPQEDFLPAAVSRLSLFIHQSPLHTLGILRSGQAAVETSDGGFLL
ncbi:MAG: hypothetical protein IJ812_03160, partial [Schwartzia sp.]|nr:hypothetical protein [Schwartzia sp. (in: firmicutes)]